MNMLRFTIHKKPEVYAMLSYYCHFLAPLPIDQLLKHLKTFMHVTDIQHLNYLQNSKIMKTDYHISLDISGRFSGNKNNTHYLFILYPFLTPTTIIFRL